MHIDILLATYNGEQYLGEQLDSLLRQTYTHWRLFIHDDNSTDKTLEIIRSFITRYPDKIVLIDDNIVYGSALSNFMYLLQQVEGEYFMFCDQDDVWLPNKIELSLNKMKQIEKTYGSAIPLLIFTDLKVTNKNLELMNRSFWNYQKLDPKISQNWKKLLAQNVITGCTIMINKKAKDVCLPVKLHIMMHDHWIGVNVSKYGQIAYLPEQTILYRQHQHNVEGAKNFGLKYIFSKLIQLKKISTYQKKVSNYFQEITILELIYYKIILNLQRLLK